ncbi:MULTISPECIES: HPP family protein [Stenotrophomonas]|uniref:HPP family protein n=1 Tax=Stenotrophomonas TaxID=40323 RepID=UPI0007703A34|nr:MULTISPECIES: HPP family protein [Stenotrophomonas]AMJ57984.1 HPP domain-containing protein [Stenotrophomonas sp. KCTC 12332]
MTSSSKPLHPLRNWLSIERNQTSHGEKWISALGALIGITVVYQLTHWCFPGGFGNHHGGAILLASMGASAVLVFAVPHGALSQPWAVIAGHLVSAFIGVSCQLMFPEQAWTGALAVGLAVGAMHYLRCIHPPGGATALAAVIGGSDVHALGYHYLLTPVAINVAAILLAGIAFNACFAWRRYPVHLHRRRQQTAAVPSSQRRVDLTQEDFHAAIGQLNSFVDITDENLTELLELAKQHAERDALHPDRIEAGRCYSNGRLGRAWSVRRVTVTPALSGPVADRLVYAVVAGDGIGDIGHATASELRQWARFEVTLREGGRWAKLGSD